MKLFQNPSTWLLGAMVLASGCGSGESLPTEHLELLPAVEKTVEFHLGEFNIPIPETLATVGGERPPRNYMQLEFTLLGEVAVQDEPALAKVFPRREGGFRDRVFEICRSSSAEELNEPNLLTLKMRLNDGTESLLGTDLVRKMIIPSLKKYEM